MSCVDLQIVNSGVYSTVQTVTTPNHYSDLHEDL